ncbi:glycosyltransferase family 2 protein [Rufibacter sp. LB8]|uniref:glycosyltransferase family 2 protein n=1 Tax=Rufibacter sp. LB8 TaxID=2777781 RepID=UPI00178C4B1A|nr:glycosyltransferase family 2 protein [Rufibacter sp. LB8]
MKKISLIIPFYNEGAGVKTFFDTLFPIIQALPYEFELICVDDGSQDSTLAELRSIQTHAMKIISFSRNFGKEVAITAGIDYATGHAVVPLDADLQDPPSLLPRLLEEWEKGFDVVLAVRSQREDGFFKNLTAKLFYQLINRISETPIHKNVGDFRLMDSTVTDVIKRMPERNRFMKGLLSWPGFKTTEIQYSRPKANRKAKQNYNKLFKLAFDGIISYSDAPLRLIMLMGLGVTLASFIYAVITFIKVLVNGIDVPGYNSTLIVILFIGGVIIISIGTVGLYISKIFNEVKSRPLYVVQREFLSPEDTTYSHRNNFR